MRTYRFSGVSAIKEVAFRHVGNRRSVALLSAADDAAPEQLSAIRHAIAASGWQCVPATVDGHDVLQVEGFGTEEECFAFLANQRFASGTAQIVAETKELTKPDTRSAMQKFLQLYSLQLAGALNLIGDVGILWNGVETRDKNRVAGGVLYTLGGLNIARFGGVKPQENMREISEDVANLIKRKTGDLPDGSGLAEVDAHRDANKRSGINRFLYRNAAQNTLGAYTLGAIPMLASGIKKDRAGKGSAGLHYGISSLVFKAASFLIPEKARKENDKAAEESKGIIEWFREKPLRLFGYGSIITEFFLARDAYEAFKHNPQQRGHIYTGVATAAYILADLMMVISSKDPTNAGDQFSAEEQRRIEALAAEESIAREPKETQHGLIQQVAEFLAARAEMKGDADAIGASIAEQAAHMGRNPWVARVSNGPTLQPAR